MKLLIIRNDKLGDFVLSLPTFSLLKKHIPDSEIHALIPEYTKDIATLSKSIDNVVIDPGLHSSFKQNLKLLRTIRENKYDAIITLFPTTRIGLLSFLSGTKYRLAPATKISQVFYNHRLVQRRSQSKKPEYIYNLDLAIKYLEDQEITINEFPKAPYLELEKNDIIKFREQFYSEHKLEQSAKLIFIHPGSGGSATNLSLTQYAELAKDLNTNKDHVIVLSAGPADKNEVQQLSLLLKETSHIIYYSTQGLQAFTKAIQLCDIFISNSTGPLHIAGALNRPTAAFYQRRRSATPLRWQTLNSEDKRLAFTPPPEAHESDLHSIDVVSAAKEINKKFLNT